MGGELPTGSGILVDDDGIEQLIARLEEFGEETDVLARPLLGGLRTAHHFGHERARPALDLDGLG